MSPIRNAVRRLLPAAWTAELWQRNTIVVLAVAASNYIAFDLATPFLPLYVFELGATNFSEAALWSGALVGITPFITTFIGPAWAAFADRHGRKRVALLTIVLISMSMALMATATTLPMLLAFRGAMGLLGGFSTLSLALATTGCPRDRIGQVIGNLQSVQYGALAIIPPLGGLLVDNFGVRSSFFVAAGCCLAGALLLAFGYRQPPSEQSESPAGARDTHSPVDELGSGKSAQAEPSTLDLLRLPGFISTMAVLFGVHFVERSFFTVVPLFVVLLIGAGEGAGATTGLIIGLGALATALSANLYGLLARRHSPDLLLRLALVGGMLIVPPVALVTSVEGLAILRVLQALVAGGALTLAFTRAGRDLPAGRAATGFSLLNSGAMLGAAISPFLVGLLASLNLRAVFVVDGLLYALALGVVLWLFRR